MTFNLATDATLNVRRQRRRLVHQERRRGADAGRRATYSGITTINGGTLKLGAPSYQPALMHLAMDGAVGPINDGDPVPDASGSGNNATMIGGGASYVAGQFGQAINFTDGQYLQAAPVNNGVLGEYTVSLWMNVASANNSQGWHSICSTRSGASSSDRRHADRVCR